MDNPQEPQNIISFCSGYGGIELGFDIAEMRYRVLAYVEREAFAVANLVAKMEQGHLVPAPVWTNLKTFPVEKFRGRVDGITAGYPCQPFSAAGQRKGKDDPRHLWPYIRQAIRTIQPRWCFFENVEGHVSLGLSTVISDLEEDGYRTTWGLFSASEVGAPIKERKRVFLLSILWGYGRKKNELVSKELDRTWQKAPMGQLERMDGSKAWCEAIAEACRMDNGLDEWVDRLRLLGNGVVPQTSAKAWIELNKRMNKGWGLG